LESVEAIFRFLLEKGYCLSLKDLDIDGNDLKRLGFSGIEIGKALDHLLERVIDEPELNEKEILEKLALEYMLDQASISNDPAT
jgi:tRNA nucleotidyltransferase (CCA-adding enzyme)